MDPQQSSNEVTIQEFYSALFECKWISDDDRRLLGNVQVVKHLSAAHIRHIVEEVKKPASTPDFVLLVALIRGEVKGDTKSNTNDVTKSDDKSDKPKVKTTFDPKEVPKLYLTAMMWLHILWVCMSILGINIHTLLAVSVHSIASLFVFLGTILPSAQQKGGQLELNIIRAVVQSSWILSTVVLTVSILLDNTGLATAVRLAMIILTGIYTQFVITAN